MRTILVSVVIVGSGVSLELFPELWRPAEVPRPRCRDVLLADAVDRMYMGVSENKGPRILGTL